MDAALLSRAYENILDNALRFTPEDGTVTVSAAVVDGGDLKVRIADSGPGVAAEDLPHLFDPFYRGTGTSSGFGLGLSIARSITDAHGFSLDVDSREAPGTTFVIRVPARLISAGAGQHRIMGMEVIPTDVQHAAARLAPATVSKDLRAARSAADLASTPTADRRQSLRG
jgi:anti-sigma regulatory factor (Ser/Thr protein kinase)